MAREVTPWLRAAAGAPEGIITKPDGTHCTDCDEEMEQRIRVVCNEVLADPFLFLGEESEAKRSTPISAIRNAECIVVVDPIDGTSNFIQGNSAFGSLIGVYHQRADSFFEPVFGAILLPEEEQLYLTDESGVEVVDLSSGQESRLAVKRQTDQTCLRISAYPSHDRFLAPQALLSERIERVMTFASITDFNNLILGETRLAIIGGKWWDIAALLAVAQQLSLQALSLRDKNYGFRLSLDDFILTPGDSQWSLQAPIVLFAQDDGAMVQRILDL